MNVLKEQYEVIRYTRESLFQFMEQINGEDYVKGIEGFGWGSMRNLHVHVADCYQAWLGHFAFKEDRNRIHPETIASVKEMREVFLAMDRLVYRFLDTYEQDYRQKIIGHVPLQEKEEQLSALWLFTHTITHEFHHKGQVVSMARQLGYTPTDTDLITPADQQALL
ncbi:DinB family protein [Sediminibacillus albus]|uniref:Uncharacterized damage-inducible protein DinB (Forms a four-helix bundle) n=1 Tax=Sediminibacillus albus TaxID=407036 RepID=A0A1G8Y4Z7_9BACI|nr:DinB family protein [Sediminibacillus albus]SDJ97474.1 Uncharacterized damage-inducible protein DinB (forms a four-helix bundle) [Sediminibacillus albus]